MEGIIKYAYFNVIAYSIITDGRGKDDEVELKSAQYVLIMVWVWVVFDFHLMVFTAFVFLCFNKKGRNCAVKIALIFAYHNVIPFKFLMCATENEQRLCRL